MNSGSYEITNYHPDYKNQVAELQKFLWGNDIALNLLYFKWKYEDNPLANNLVGTIALHKDEVVGFRGFFVERWGIGKKDNNIPMLALADTVVHQDHRRKGLFSGMTIKALQEFEKLQYKGILNFSSSRKTVPGYIKMGWEPMVDRTYLRKFNFTGLLNLIIGRQGKLRNKNAKVKFGKFGSVEVSTKPQPEEMYSVFIKQNCLGEKLTLFKDIDFFKWRFQNPRAKYIFYYFSENKVHKGYIIIKTSEHSPNGHIVDYSYTELTAVQEILKFIIRNKHFDVISIWKMNLENEFLQILRKVHFNPKSMIGRLEKRFKDQFPILIRPVKEKYSDKDWYVQDLDMRDVENWRFAEICSDGC